MKKIGNVLFITACLLVCMIPFAAMTFASTQTTTENREMAQFPQLKEDGTWNQEYLQELGAYFEDHFAFRPALVMADSVIQSSVFGVSNMDTVIVGDEGWLYYTATLGDYQGTNCMSDRSIYNAAHNLSLMQDYVQQRGAEFLLTIAPNKNSLYGENMPYYYQKKVSNNKNLDMLELQLEKYGIVYTDLYDVFASQDEILYLKRDSHWNQKGAVLAYNTILDDLECEHETYETVSNVRTKTEYGDLNKMIYPVAGVPEWNYCYQKEQQFTYVTDTESVEDAWIETANDAGEGSLLMFRDSFGNTLLPLMADVFEKGYFSKSQPYKIETYMKEYTPEYVVVEKVERNISEFAMMPPIMTGPVVELQQSPEFIQTGTTIEMKESEADSDYWEISGLVDDQYVKVDTNIYINMISDGCVTCYEAFTVTKDSTDCGYQLYIPKNNIASEDVGVEILIESDGVIQKVATQEINMNELRIANEG